MLEQIIKDEIETIIQEKGLTKTIKDIVRQKMSNENIQQIIEMEIDKLLPEAVMESVQYQLSDSDIVHNATHRKLKEMIENRILNWK